MPAAHVWIADGCIHCHACSGNLPEVFRIDEEGAVVLGGTRCDGVTSRNADERSLLNAEGLEYEDAIREAVAGCPIEIIHFEDA